MLYSRVVPGGERCTVLRGHLQRKGHTWPGSDEKAFVRDAHGRLRPDELHLYCYRVVGTVGLVSMPVFGCAPRYTDELAK